MNNTRLVGGEVAELYDGDVIRFGVNVENGQGMPISPVYVKRYFRLTDLIESFPALIVRCKIDWTGEEYAAPLAWFPWSGTDNIFRNPCDVDSNDGVAIMDTSIALPDFQPRPSAHTSTNTFRVPESDSDVEEIPFNKFGWASQKSDDSHAEANDSQIPTPVSSETHDMKDACELPHGSTSHAESTKPKIGDESMDLATKSVYPNAKFHIESRIDRDGEEEEFFREVPVSYDGNAEDELEDEIDNEIENILGSGVDDYSNDDYASEDISSASDASSDDESSSVDNERVQECIDPMNVYRSKTMPNTRDLHSDDFWKALDESHIEFNRLIRDAPSPPTRCTIPSLLNFPPPQKLNEEEVLRVCAPIEDIPSLEDPKPSSSSTSYHDGPFACFESTADETKIEREITKPKAAMKRKASEMETEDAPLPSRKVSFSQEPSIHTIEQSEAATAISSALSEAEHSSKRVKTSHSSNLASYTATAVVSALLGGLGTIALLAALPAGYFGET